MPNELKTPERVVIGPLEYQVKIVKNLRSDDNKRLAGMINGPEATIYLTEEQSPQFARIVLWHEMIHGILDAAGFQAEHNEAVVDALAHGLVDVILRNPDLIDG